MESKEHTTGAIFAATTDAHDPRLIRLQPPTRLNHTLIFGAASEYKTGLQWNMMVQDIEAGAGVAVIDTTGNFAERLVDAIPPRRAGETYIFQPGDARLSYGFNPFARVPLTTRSTVAQHITDLFSAIWGFDYRTTPLALDFLRGASRALLDFDGASMLSLYPFFINKDYRNEVLASCEHRVTKHFFSDFSEWSDREQRDKVQPVLTRLRSLLSDDRLCRTFGQTEATLNLAKVCTDRQVLLADLNRFTLGQETSRLYASLLTVSAINCLAGANDTPVYIFLPDADFLPDAVAAMLLGAPLAGAGAVVSLNDVSSIDSKYRSSVLAAETLLAFRLGTDDIRATAVRFPVSRPEATLANLASNRLCQSGFRYELQSAPALYPMFSARQRVQWRSRGALTEAADKVQRKVDRFWDRTLFPGDTIFP